MSRSIDKMLSRLDTDNHPALRKTGSVIETVQDAQAMYTRVRTWWRQRTEWTVTVTAGDRLYDSTLRWFLSEEADTAPPRQVKAVLTRNTRSRFVDDYLDGVGTRDAAPTVSVLYDERSQRRIVIDGHRIKVMMSRRQEMAAPQESGGYRPATPDSLYFYCSSYEGQQTVLRLLDEIAADQQKSKPALHLMTQWGDWLRRDDLPERQLDSVVLAPGQMELLRDDLQQFIDDEHEYVRRGIPYHRGYLLHGQPGTGKTSVVRALAAHFGLDLWYAPLGDLQKDTSLLTLINQVRSGSILLLEDVDVFNAMHTRDNTEDSAPGLSTAGLLNALDGVATPHGLIVFLTTNDKSVIDPAILRPGRVDLQVEIGMPDQDQVARLYETWFTVKLTSEQRATIQFDGSTAAVTEVLKQNLKDPAGGLAGLQQPAPPVEERPIRMLPAGEDDGGRGRRIRGSVGYLD